MCNNNYIMYRNTKLSKIICTILYVRPESSLIFCERYLVVWNARSHAVTERYMQGHDRSLNDTVSVQPMLSFCRLLLETFHVFGNRFPGVILHLFQRPLQQRLQIVQL